MINIITLLIFLNVLVAAEDNIKVKEIVISETVKLVIEYNDCGTKSEGQTGKLIINGNEIIGEEGDIKEINGIKFKYYKKHGEGPWDIKGWNYNDSSLILNSSKK